MTSPKQYHLRITAGPSYDLSTHQIVPVNTSTPLTIDSPHITTNLCIRIASFRGLPSSSPSTSPYFEHDPHEKDRYSIQFEFKLKEDNVPGTDLVFGNDFEKPIKDKLPTGFGTAYRLLRWAIDPGLDGDVYSEHPYLYGPLLSSINVLRIGEKSGGAKIKARADGAEEGEALKEGADGDDAKAIRQKLKIPDDGAKRMKHYLNEGHKKEFVFEKERLYECDFFNGYLDFNDLSLKLPGVTMQLMSFWDGQPLRYVLKHRNAAKNIDQELLVITFTLIPEEELEAEKAKWEGGESGAKGGGSKNKAETKNVAREEEDVD